jgi:hypothetical protein
VLELNFLGDRFCLGDILSLMLDKADRGDDALGEFELSDEDLDNLGVVSPEDERIGKLDKEDVLDFLGNSVINLQAK